MRPLSTVPSFLFVLLFCGSAYADKVSVDWDRQADFRQYKTYAWLESPNPPEDQLMGKRIMQAVDTQLSAKGLQRVDPGQDPDLTVVYDSGVYQKTSWVPYPWAPAWGWYGGPGPGYGSFWYGPGWGWYDAPDAFYPLVQDIGTLSVNITDEHQKQLVWRGVASDALKDKPEKNARKICELIAKMFRKYPPPGCCGHVSWSSRPRLERQARSLESRRAAVKPPVDLRLNFSESAGSARFSNERPPVYSLSCEMDLRS